MYAHSGTLLFLLNLAPQRWLGTCHSALQFDPRTLELPPAIHIQRTQTMCSPVTSVLGLSLSSWRALVVPQLYAVPLSSLLCISCSTGSQLSLRRNCCKYRCTYDVFLGVGELSIYLNCHLGLFLNEYEKMPNQKSLIKMGKEHILDNFKRKYN